MSYLISLNPIPELYTYVTYVKPNAASWGISLGLSMVYCLPVVPAIEDIFTAEDIQLLLFLMLTSAVVIFICLLSLSRKEISLPVTRTDLLLLLFAGYALSRYNHPYSPNTDWIGFVLLFGLYFLTKYQFQSLLAPGRAGTTGPLLLLVAAFLAAGIWQAGMGFIQIITQMNDSPAFGSHAIKGSFSNPGPYANYLSTTAVFGAVVSLTGRENPAWLRKMAGIALVTSCCVLPCTMGRTAWLGVVIPLAAFAFMKNKSRLAPLVQSSDRKALLLAGTLLLSAVALAGYYLFYLKPASALGRLLIWKVSLQTIGDHFWLGSGFQSFAVVYNNYQANYFLETDAWLPEALLADSVRVAFNEYLQVWVELGLAGVLILAAVVLSCIHNGRLPRQGNPLQSYYCGSRLAVLTLLICASSSYPFSTFATTLQGVFCLGLLNGYDATRVGSVKIPSPVSKTVAVLAIAVCTGMMHYAFVTYRATVTWKKAAEGVPLNGFSGAAHTYRQLHPVLHGNGLFLFNYGAELIIAEQYTQGVEVLHEALKYYNDPEVWVYLGDGHRATGNFRQAEVAYRHAGAMVPNRLFPKYRLFELYKEYNAVNRALNVARLIIDTPVKIPTAAAYQIKQDASSYLLDRQR